jgi:hypothetical protein
MILSIFLSELKNSNKFRKLSSWKNFDSKFTTPFKMILVKMVASNLISSTINKSM